MVFFGYRFCSLLRRNLQGSYPALFRKAFLKLFLVFLLLSSLLCSPGYGEGQHQSANYEAKRARLLSFIIRTNLEANHFTHKKIDDTISEAAFGLYLKQLDYQKRILLFEDVVTLKKSSRLIDDEINSGNLDLPIKAWKILSARAAVVHEMVKEILSGDFDFSTTEFIETDAEKIDYCKDDIDLRERWRRILKYEILHQYLSQPEENAAAAEDAIISKDGQKEKKSSDDKETMKAARDKVLKTYDAFFSRISREKETEHYDHLFSAVTHAFDPHTDYMPPADKEDFDISMRGSLEGIGATLKEDEGAIKVVSIVPGSPASRNGQLDAGDIILRVGEGNSESVSISGMRVKDAVKLIRGKKGTEVRLTIRKPDDKILLIRIVRDIIQLEETFVKSAALKNSETGDTFGYVKIPSFYRDFEGTSNGNKGRNVTDDVRAALATIMAEPVKGLILDLRNNGGGALTDAVRIAGLFIEKGPVVQVKNSNEMITTMSDDAPDIAYDGPIVILVNTISASASEILAGALQNYGRGIVIGGEHTHGKGTVQTIRDLDGNIPFQNMEAYKPLGALRLTTQKFYRINGDSTQYRGVVPDIILPDVMSGLRTGEQYLDFALPWDTVKPVAFELWKKCRPELPALREKSRTRVKANQQFIDMEKEAARLAEKKKNTLKSLNKEDVRREIEESRKQKEKDTNKTSHGKAKPNKEAKTPEEKRKEFLKAVSDDDYVKEAMSVIKDTIVADPSCLSTTAN